ncbi:MAG TPA: glycerophosphodiester phosphodiesterase [Acidimicrobiales bacterium]|nr:glycerophosphodiester phosphodiesterase [Acidimicrobiales bacterium]
MASFPFLDWPGPLAFAHQGAHAEGGPGENTMAAFEAAVALGYRYLETDAHVTADGVLVAFHDDHLDRLTDRAGVIGDLPWAEVGAARVRGGEGVPLLEDLLTAWPDVRINIDPKHDAAVDPLVELIRRTGTLDRVCFGAFSDKRLSRIQAGLGPGACTSMGPRQVARLVAAARRLPAGSFTAACVQVPTRQGRIPLVTPRFLAAAHARDLPVHVWTINDAADMHRLLDMGVDGIMTDRTDVLKKVLVERGSWVS